MQILTIVFLCLFALASVVFWSVPYAIRSKRPGEGYSMAPGCLFDPAFLLAAFLTSRGIDSPSWWLSPSTIGYGGLAIYALGWVHLVLVLFLTGLARRPPRNPA